MHILYGEERKKAATSFSRRRTSKYMWHYLKPLPSHAGIRLSGANPNALNNNTKLCTLAFQYLLDQRFCSGCNQRDRRSRWKVLTSSCRKIHIPSWVFWGLLKICKSGRRLWKKRGEEKGVNFFGGRSLRFLAAPSGKRKHPRTLPD